jgi:hypothetical protein
MHLLAAVFLRIGCTFCILAAGVVKRLGSGV